MTLAVIGASLAGLRAVESARRNGFSDEIVLIGAEDYLPYDRPPLSKAVLSGAAVTTFRTEQDLCTELGVRLMLGAPAEAIDTDAREIHVAGQRVHYDSAIIATGAKARTLPGTEAMSGVYTLRTRDDAEAVRDKLDAGARVVVIGAGFIGAEVASAARARDLPVTMLDSAEAPLTRSVGVTAGKRCAQLHRDAGVSLRLGVGVDGLETQAGTVTGVRTDTGEVLAADLVVVGVGAAPATQWLASSGIALHERDGGVLCDATLATSAPCVYAAGDITHVPNALFDDARLRLEHWTNASEQGMAAAKHAVAPESAAALNSVPYFWSDWYGRRLQFVGVPDGDEVYPVDDDVYLYRRADRLVGAFTIDHPREVMKLRRRIAARGNWDEAVEYARSLR